MCDVLDKIQEKGKAEGRIEGKIEGEVAATVKYIKEIKERFQGKVCCYC